MEPYRETFNDGFLAYGHKTTQRTTKGKRIGDAFSENGRLAFKELSRRESDFQMAGIMGASLDMKVKTLFPPAFRNINKSKLKVVISNVEYDVIKCDSDANKRYLYFYLQEVGVVGE